MNGHPDRAKRLAAVATAHDDWAGTHAAKAAFDPVRAARKPGSDYNLHYLDVNPPPGAEEDFDRRVRRMTADLATPVTITEQALDLASDVKVAPEAMQPPGLPVPDDPAAISLFTAHRIDEILHKLSHASQRMEAARSASGDLRKYHAERLAGHLKAALDAGHDLAANIRSHYPAESDELDAVAETVGLAKAVSEDAKAATTAHLLETTLHELTHADRHAQQMTEDTPDDEFEFNADHCEKHLGGAAEHAGKLEEHFKDNYPDVAKWLNGLGEVTADAEDDGGKQHARYSKGTVSAQMANTGTITGQLE